MSYTSLIRIAIITDINTTSPQRFVITDGADTNPVEQFVVDSTNGNTTILGDVTVNANFTLAGSTTANSQVLTITTGGSSPVTTFTVDSTTGGTCLKGDFGADGTNCDRLTLIPRQVLPPLVLVTSGWFTVRSEDDPPEQHW